MTNLTAPRFNDVDAAREHLEALHWPQGPVCPHCGSVDCKRLPAQRGRPSKRNPEGAIRKGVVQCNGCRQQFTVIVGTVFSDSKVPLNKWLLAVHLLTSSKKGISSHQLSRNLGVSYKTAWFMSHRIREAMIPGDTGPMGGDGGFVEADETYYNRDATKPFTPRATMKGMTSPNFRTKLKILTLVERNTGRATSVVFDDMTIANFRPLLAAAIAPEAILMTDQAPVYRHLGSDFAGHESVNHGNEEYVRKGSPLIHTNTVEGFFSVFKRGMKGVYQHCAKHHLHRYLAEFDFRYSNREALGVNDDERADRALLGITGKRLTYRRIGLAA